VKAGERTLQNILTRVRSSRHTGRLKTGTGGGRKKRGGSKLDVQKGKDRGAKFKRQHEKKQEVKRKKKWGKTCANKPENKATPGSRRKSQFL